MIVRSGVKMDGLKTEELETPMGVELMVSGVGFGNVDAIGWFVAAADVAGDSDGTTADERLAPGVQVAVTDSCVGIVITRVGQSVICRTTRVTTRSDGTSVGIINVPII